MSHDTSRQDKHRREQGVSGGPCEASNSNRFPGPKSAPPAPLSPMACGGPLLMSAHTRAAAAVEGLRARDERRAGQGGGFGTCPGQTEALAVWAPKERPRAHLARAEELAHGKVGSFAWAVSFSLAAPTPVGY